PPPPLPVAAGGVGAQQGLDALDRVTAPRLLQQLLAAHPALRLHQVELVKPAHEAAQLMLDLTQLALDALPLIELALMLLGDDRDVRLQPIALSHRLARLHVGPLPLGGQVAPALRGLR